MTDSNPIDSQVVEIPHEAVKQEVHSPVSQDTATSILLSESTARKEEIVMPEEPVIRITRQQLYDEIWKISVYLLQNRNGQSCKKNSPVLQL